MRGLVVAAVVTVSAIAQAGKPGGIIVPPIEAELGMATPIRTATPLANSTELHIGAHWASLAWKPTRFDVGIGFSGSYRTLTDQLAEASLSLNGLYFSLAYAIESHRNWRTWLGGRVDTLTGEYQGRSLNVVGGSVRLGAEIFSAGAAAAGDRNGLAFIAGAWALGVFVEGTARTLPDELGPIAVSAGVSMRVPFILAVVD